VPTSIGGERRGREGREGTEGLQVPLPKINPGYATAIYLYFAIMEAQYN